MRLLSIKPTWFRAFGNTTDPINIDADLVVLHGANGFGKSSLSEAMEWLFFGKTKRRAKGEKQSGERDYQGSFRNVHALSADLSSVEMKVRLKTGVEHMFKRDLIEGPRNSELSKTYIDGIEEDFTSFGLHFDEIYDPILAQDSLKDFIHSRPKDRRDKISSAFGLEPLIRFKSVLDKARERFQRTPPQSVQNAQSIFRATIAAMRNCPAMIPIANRWDSNNVEAGLDKPAIYNAIVEYLGSGVVEENAVKDRLLRLREKASQRIFETAPISPPSDFSTKTAIFTQSVNPFENKTQELISTFEHFLQQTVALYSQSLLGFWRTGLGLPPQRDNQCPMCEEDTLTQAKRSEIQGRIDASKDYTATKEAFERNCTELVQLFSRIETDITGLLPKLLNLEQSNRLIDLFPSGDLALASFLSVHDGTKRNLAVCNASLARIKRRIQSIPTQAQDVTKVTDLQRFLTKLSEMTKARLTTILKEANGYHSAFTSFKILLEARVAKQSSILEIDGMLKPLNNWQSIIIVAAYNQLLNDVLVIIQLLQRHIQTKQNALFSSRGQEIFDWYDLMNRGASVKYRKIEPGTDSLTIWGESFGKDINAAACLSECQLNCLGLSIHFTRALSPGSPFGFLLLDDPVQSMDDDHCQALIIDVLKKLFEEGKQIIVISHVAGLIDDIWETYYDKQPRRLRISDFQISGPTIEDAETLDSALKRAVSLSKGNEDNRRLSVKVVRRCVELLIRANCRKTGSQPPPDSSTAKAMIPYFQTCPGTNPTQTQELQATINFSNPGPHTQQGWTPPTQPQIKPHIDRLNQIARDLQLL